MALVEDRIRSGFVSEGSGREFILRGALARLHAAGTVESLVSPGDPTIDPESKEWRNLVDAYRSGKRVDASLITSYAGRDTTRFPIRSDRVRLIIACDAGPYHEDGIHVLYDSGIVTFKTWKELGIAGGAEFRVGQGGVFPELSSD